jgi:peptidoglycan/LPS O-acetylase OafA/YrhL
MKRKLYEKIFSFVILFRDHINPSFVLISHFHIGYQRFFAPDTLIHTTLSSFGYFGVKIFFVISGYLITLLMLKEEERTGRVNLRQFYIRRAFRILPAAIAFMVAVFIYNGSDISLADKILSFLFLENYANPADWRVRHMWSLGVEEQFYLLWPLLFIAWPRTRKRGSAFYYGPGSDYQRCDHPTWMAVLESSFLLGCRHNRLRLLIGNAAAEPAS